MNSGDTFLVGAIMVASCERGLNVAIVKLFKIVCVPRYENMKYLRNMYLLVKCLKYVFSSKYAKTRKIKKSHFTQGVKKCALNKIMHLHKNPDDYTFVSRPRESVKAQDVCEFSFFIVFFFGHLMTILISSTLLKIYVILMSKVIIIFFFFITKRKCFSKTQ